MSSRAEILRRVRQQLPQSGALPDLNDNWIRYEYPVDQFAKILAGVGGECRVVSDRAAATEFLNGFPPYASAKARVSLVEGVGSSSVDLAVIDDPHDLEHIDYAILPGHVAVAENAAVWVTDRGIPHRVLYFLSQHVALVVPKSQLVSNMKEAYDRIRVGEQPFGAFISGPSKTADIEQSLVIGAHGARSMIVFLVDEDISE